MFKQFADGIEYLVFLFHLVKGLIRNDPPELRRDLFKYFNQLFNGYIEVGQFQVPIIGYTPRRFTAVKTVQFDSKVNFKKAMTDVVDDFGRAYETIRQYLLTREEPEIKDVVQWMDKVIQYNVPHGKKMRGLSLATSYKYFAPKNSLTEKNIELSYILGWCMEFFHASTLIIDDIMDKSPMRRGKSCWYTNDEVGNMAINDGFLLHHTVFEIIKHFFSEHKYYSEIAELTRMTSYKTALGQCVDCITPESGTTDFSLLTASRYATIVKYKTSIYSFGLPFRLAWLFAGINDQRIHNEAQKILIRMGHLFQCQDDFNDCFGDPKITGKIGTDIQEGKCCWIAVEAMKRMSAEQINVFKTHYGRSNKNCLTIVKNLYKKVNMKTVFFEFEVKEYKEIRKEIAAFGKRWNIKVKPFFGLLDIIYKREK